MDQVGVIFNNAGRLVKFCSSFIITHILNLNPLKKRRLKNLQMNVQHLGALLKPYHYIIFIILLGWTIHGVTIIETADSAAQAGGRKVFQSDLQKFSCHSNYKKGFWVSIVTFEYKGHSYLAQIGDTKCVELERNIKNAKNASYMLSDSEVYQIQINNHIVLSYQDVKQLSNFTFFAGYLLPLLSFFIYMIGKFLRSIGIDKYTPPYP